MRSHDFRRASNGSQSKQDLFVLINSGWKRHGTFIEIGAGPAIEGNNTILLTEHFFWRGVSIDCNPGFAHEWKHLRGSDWFEVADATTFSYDKFKTRHGVDVDYLQVDCDPPDVSLRALKNVFEQGIRPRIITFEHDAYIAGSNVRNESRRFLYAQPEQYSLIVEDVYAPNAGPYEDWWIRW